LTNGIEEFLSAGVVVLRVTQLDGRFIRTLQVKKMRGTAVEPDEHRFEIAAGKGVALLSSKLDVSADVEEPLQALEFFRLPKQDGE
jgi:KaiC/GvpD/RAD55 family RecA-like ATPase